jgi:hypothetical protein
MTICSSKRFFCCFNQLKASDLKSNKQRTSGKCQIYILAQIQELRGGKSTRVHTNRSQLRC